MLDTTGQLMIIFGSIISISLMGIYINKRYIQNIAQNKMNEFRKRFSKKRIKPIALMTDKELREELNEKTEVRTQELTGENVV